MGIISRDDLKRLLMLWPVALLAIYPLVLRTRILQRTATEANLYPGGMTGYDDIFLKSKIEYLWLVAAVFLFLVLADILMGKRVRIHRAIAVGGGVYLGMVLLSSALSAYPDIVFQGMQDRLEGLWTQLLYITLMFLTYAYVYLRKNSGDFIKVFSAVAVVVAVGAICQDVGYNFLNNPFIVKMIVPNGMEIKAMATGAKELFPILMITSTLNNPNFLSHFLSVFAAIATVAIIINRSSRYYVAVLLFVLYGMLASTSAGGMLGYMIALNLFLVISRDVVEQRRATKVALVWLGSLFAYAALNGFQGIGQDSFRVMVVGIGITAAHLLGANYAKSKSVVRVYRWVLLVLMALLLIGIGVYVFKDSPDSSYVKSITLKSGALTTIYSDGTALHYRVDGEQIQVTDSSGKTIEHQGNSKGIYTPKDTKYKEFLYLIKKSKNAVMFSTKKPDLRFFIHKGQLVFMNTAYRPVEIQNPESCGFKNNEKFGSGRGYIWSRSIPLIKNTILVGGGPDSFAFQFPQNDFLGKARLGTTYLIVDKPHNWYLQMAINFGMPAMLAVLFMMLYPASVAARNGFSQDTVLPFIAIVAYGLGGLVNDSIPSVSPVFWILTGVLYASMMLSENEKEVQVQ